MNKSKEKIKENPIVANRAIYMANRVSSFLVGIRI